MKEACYKEGRGGAEGDRNGRRFKDFHAFQLSEKN